MRYRFSTIIKKKNCTIDLGSISVSADTQNFWYRIDIGRYTEFLVSDRYRYRQILRIFGIGSISVDTPIFGIRSISADTLNFWYRIDIGIGGYSDFWYQIDIGRYTEFLVSDRYRYWQILRIFGIGSISVLADTPNFCYRLDIGIDRYSEFLVLDLYRYWQILQIFGIGSISADTLNFWYQIDIGIGRYSKFLELDRYRQILRFLVSDRYRQIH